jgi:hypothetical protein
MNHMEDITYAFVAPARMFGPYAGARVAEAALASALATMIYVAGSLLLGLAGTRIEPGNTRSAQEHPGL